MTKKKKEIETENDMNNEYEQAKIEMLEEEIEKLQEETASYKDRWLRAAAEFENFRRRNEKDRIDWIKNANKDLILELINVYEHLEMAMKSADTDQVPENFRKGIVMVHDQLKSLLEKYGLRRIEAVGEEFDPQYHQAIICTEKDGFDDNIIFDCIQNGYILNDKVLRHARVAVAKAPEEEIDEDQEMPEDEPSGIKSEILMRSIIPQGEDEKIEINSHKKKKKIKVNKKNKNQGV
ncbi:MAG: nucleotide exchange factor GrpE [Candidatus Celaenobacter polaris]|nr:nucleotide exchange factor GrpE [Candidatus Celaenobacter polaris]